MKETEFREPEHSDPIVRLAREYRDLIEEIEKEIEEEEQKRRSLSFLLIR